MKSNRSFSSASPSGVCCVSSGHCLMNRGYASVMAGMPPALQAVPLATCLDGTALAGHRAMRLKLASWPVHMQPLFATVARNTTNNTLILPGNHPLSSRNPKHRRRANWTRVRSLNALSRVAGMRLAPIMVTCLLLTLTLPGMAQAGGASGGTYCRAVTAYVSAAVKIRAKHTSCRRARQVAGRYQTGATSRAMFGWRCSSETVKDTKYSLESAVTCRKGPGRITFRQVMPFDGQPVSGY